MPDTVKHVVSVLAFERRTFWVAAIAVTLLSPIGVLSANGNQRRGSQPIVIDAKIQVQQAGLFEKRFSAEVSAGTFEAGKKIDLVINLENTTGREYTVKKVIKTCSCVVADVEQRTYKPGEAIQIKLELKPAKRSDGTKITQVLRLVEDPGMIHSMVAVKFDYDLDGVMAFPEETQFLSVPKDGGAWKVSLPFHYSSPVELRNVVLDASPSGPIRKMEVKETDDPNVAKLQVIIDSKKLGPNISSVRIKMKDKVASAEDTITLVVREQKLFELAPSFVRFKESGGDVFEATCVLVRNGADLEDGSRKPVVVNALVGGKKIKCQVIGPTNKVCRIKLTAADEDLSEVSIKEINWSILGGEGKAVLSTSFQLP